MDGDAMIRKELWKKFYDIANHLGVSRQEVTLSTGDVLVFQHGPIQELSAAFEQAIANDTALDMITQLEGILFQRGFSLHSYAPKRTDLTKSECTLVDDKGKVRIDMLEIPSSTVYLKKKAE